LSLEISHRLYQTSGALDREVVLPSIPDAQEHDPSFLDRIGEQVQGGIGIPALAGGGIVGGGIGAKLLGSVGSVGGIGKGLFGGIAGGIGGIALIGTGLGLFGGDGEHDDVPEPSTTSREPATTVTTGEDVRVMTYNLHGGMGGKDQYGSTEEELDRLADVIRKEDPDVVVLQEVDKFATRSDHKDVLAELDERLDPTSAVGAAPSTTIFGRDQQNAVMTFNGFEVQDARNLVHQDPRGGGIAVRAEAAFRDLALQADKVLGTSWEPGENYQARNTIEAMVTTPEGNDVRVFGGHYESLGQDQSHQQEQVGTVADAMAAWRGPTIFGADFNVVAATESGAIEREMLGAAGLRNTFEDRKGFGIQGGIDRIYASDHAKVVDARVIREAGDASDHLPVVTDLHLEPGA